MFNLGNYLERFKKITPPDEAIRKQTHTSIKEKTGIDIEIKNISVKNGVVFIKTTPIYKSEIFLKKQELLDDLNNNFKNYIIKDIR